MIAKPFCKWVGGKRQVMKVLLPNIPETYEYYYEPFLGGGSVLFNVCPKKATVSDINLELVNTFQIIKTNVHELVEDLKSHLNDSEYYYTIRSLDLKSTSPLKRASRFIYLNKTCYNGLYRENKKGLFNAAFGRYESPKIVDEINLLAVSKFLNENEITINCCDYRETCSLAKEGDFVYLDPPYHPMSNTANFTKYTKNDFGKESQEDLFKEYKRLNDLGCKVLMSNSNSDFILDSYKNFTIIEVSVTRKINIDITKRGQRKAEVLIKNY